jgi:hypothetical protein
MITYFRFLLLSHEEKEQFLDENALFLLTHTKNNKAVKLYAVNDFFVEVYVNDQYKCTEIVVFKSLNKLQEHTEDIDLAQLTGHI